MNTNVLHFAHGLQIGAEQIDFAPSVAISSAISQAYTAILLWHWEYAFVHSFSSKRSADVFFTSAALWWGLLNGPRTYQSGPRFYLPALDSAGQDALCNRKKKNHKVSQRSKHPVDEASALPDEFLAQLMAPVGERNGVVFEPYIR